MADLESLRLGNKFRGLIVGYGAVAFAVLLPQYGAASAGRAGLLLIGLGLLIQFVLWGVRRRAPAAVTLHVLELVADGVTVLLFALGTFGAILRTASEV